MTEKAKTQRIIIAIDGLAGTGKTTLAKMLADKLGFVHLNSGYVYRAVGLLALQNNLALNDSTAICALINKHSISLNLDQEKNCRVLIDDKDRSDQIFTREVSDAASQISVHPQVRDLLRPVQRQAFPSAKGIVADGRDIGTVLFPNADFKFFIEVDPRIRAKRRVSQLYPDLKDANELERLNKELLAEIEIRDSRDTERQVAPTVPATDALIIDNSELTLTQALENMYDSIANGLG
ncbi:MAG: (d)CMP kinase [Bdellovibrionales bacterium]|nr:(d)CMP kinase [Bdellovibrionales bacterium]